jgi:hypothetical protein
MHIIRAASIGTAGLLAGALLQIPPATAAPATTVRYDDFPTVRAISRIFPSLAGGSRTRRGLGEPQRLAMGCLSFEDVSVRTRSSRIMLYSDARGRDIYRRGKSSPSVLVYLYRTRGEAAAALAQIRQTYVACVGTHANAGSGSAFSVVPLPALGQGRFGARRAVTDPITGSDWFSTVWVRKGRYLVESVLHRDKGAPPRASVLKLARLSARSVG